MKTSPILAIKPLGFPWETSDPFLFCVHHADAYPAGGPHMGPPPESLKGRNIGQDFTLKDGWRMYHGSTIPGFPAHPHAGFETVTIALEGLIDHSDSLGAAGRFGNGDVQWMTAGKGVQHSEMFPLLDQEAANPLELFQIWLNLPRASKKVEPHFSMLWGETIPVLHASDEQAKSIEVRVMAGQLGGLQAPSPPPDSWAANPDNEIGIWRIKMEAGATWTLPAASEGINRTVYFYKGTSLEVAGQSISSYQAVELRSDTEVSLVNGAEESHILILQGKPIEEPVVQYGPFVTNSQGEIRQVMMDFQQTQFGGWPWPSTDHVHDRSEGRFAKHADGRLERKEG
ncbi:MAG: pirin family protein [Bacteroidota bacterium]